MNFQNPMKLSCGPLIFFNDFVGVLIHNAKIPLMYLQVLQLGKCYKFVFCTFLEHRKNVYNINIFVSLQLMYLKKKHILIDLFVVFTLFTEFFTCIIYFVGIIIGKIVVGVFSFTNTVTTASSSSLCLVLMVTFKTGEQNCIQSALCSYKCINYEAKEKLLAKCS